MFFWYSQVSGLKKSNMLESPSKTTLLFKYKWASSWDYSTYQIGDQRRLRPACASTQSRQSLRCSHTYSMEVDEESDQKSDILRHKMAAYARLKNEFTEDEKYHNLMRWLK